MEFYWAVTDELAVGSLPYTDEDIRQIRNRGVKAILSLHPTTYFTNLTIDNEGLDHFTAPITDFSVPEISEMDEFARIIDNWIAKKKPVYIHCFLGRGRSRTVAAAYLAVKLGSIEEAVNRVGPPQSPAQQEFIIEYARLRTQAKLMSE